VTLIAPKSLRQAIQAGGVACKGSPRGPPTRNRPRRNRPIDVTIRHLKDNLTSRVSLTELAALAGLSVSHYSAPFRKSAGGSTD
jgi:hypothetical protein